MHVSVEGVCWESRKQSVSQIHFGLRPRDTAAHGEARFVRNTLAMRRTLPREDTAQPAQAPGDETNDLLHVGRCSGKPWVLHDLNLGLLRRQCCMQH